MGCRRRLPLGAGQALTRHSLLCCLLFLGSTPALSATDQVSFESIHLFDKTAGDGEFLNEPVTEGSDGFLYGATSSGGGPLDCGLVFRVRKSGADYQILHVFGPPSATNGSTSWGGVIEGKDGRLYGATRYGGSGDAGTIYSLARDGADFKIIHHFPTNGSAGRFPMNGVVQAKDGRLYGRTLTGGEGGGATIFGLNTDGSAFQTLHHFARSDREYYIAYSGLLVGSDGRLYGAADSEGPQGAGSVFSLSTDGSGFQTLHFFTGTGKGPEGRFPIGGVTESTEGILFGTTQGGGFDDFGVLYRIHRDGTGYRVIHEFTAQRQEGYTPASAPIEGPDNALYGTTYFGGPFDNGAIYRIRKDGSGLAFIYTFEDVDCPAWPYSALRICSDGAFYGTTFNGRGNVYGAVFRINPISLTVASNVVHLHAMTGKGYSLETTTNLADAWIEYGRQTNTTGAIAFQILPSPSPQFFRARAE
jgi:uncharacterized repeat protein (TIGR03803 family)